MAKTARYSGKQKPSILLRTAETRFYDKLRLEMGHFADEKEERALRELQQKVNNLEENRKKPENLIWDSGP